jgi:hypothetical protein
MMDTVNLKECILEDLLVLKAATDSVKRSRDALGDLFRPLLEWKLAEKTVFDINDPGYRCSIIRGRTYGTTYMIVKPFHVKVDAASPSLSRWEVEAIAVTRLESGGHREHPKCRVWIQGRIFNPYLGDDTSDAGIISRYVEEWERFVGTQRVPVAT